MSREEFSEQLAVLSRAAVELRLPAHQVILHQLAASVDSVFASSLAKHVSGWNGLGIAMEHFAEVDVDLFPKELEVIR